MIFDMIIKLLRIANQSSMAVVAWIVVRIGIVVVEVTWIVFVISTLLMNVPIWSVVSTFLDV